MATQINITADVGNLLKIPVKVTNELSNKACLCIGSAISEAKAKGEKQIAINIGIGSLGIDLLDMQCKFIPGKELKSAIKKALDSKIDPLELLLDQVFSDKLLAIFNEEF